MFAERKTAMKKLLISFAVFLFVAGGWGRPLSAAASVEINKNDLAKGLVAVKYTTSESKKAKVLIQFKETKYQYNIKSGNSFVYFPLQLGNGTYQIGVFEQVEGTKYAQLATDSVNLSLDDDSRVYLTSIQLIDWSEKMDTVSLAKALTKNKQTDAERIEVCYQYMVQQFQYDFEKLKNVEYDYIPVIDEVIKKKLGICYDYSAVFSSMLRSMGIKSKLIMGYTTNVKEYHAWNEVLVDGQWITVDTTFDSQMFAAKVQYSFEKPKADYKESFHY
jgi:transglutaminase-like putative cysteine protease